MYPCVKVSGGPRERGRAYGEQAREQVMRTRSGYEQAYDLLAGLTWAQAVESAKVYGPAISRWAPEAVEEMRGIADGAGLSFDDVLALNARTEVIWAASARDAAAQTRALGGECTAFALLGRRTSDGMLLAGQNWDWLAHATEALVVLEVELPDGRPNFVTVVEAGLLAKASVNSAGLCVMTNALVSSADRGDPRVPYHVMLRLLAECETVTDAVRTVHVTPRASSANYLVAGGDDTAVDIEAAPGGQAEVSCLLPCDGVLTHTNHFKRLPPGVREVSIYAMPDTLVRLQRIDEALRPDAGRWDVPRLHEVMSDHAGWPATSICHHPDPRVPAEEAQWGTIMSLVASPAERRVWLASGRPCETPYQELELGSLLHKQTELGEPPPGVEQRAAVVGV